MLPDSLSAGPASPGRRFRRVVALAGGLCALALLLGLAYAFVVGPRLAGPADRQAEAGAGVPAPPGGGMPATPFVLPGLRTPPVRPGATAALAADAPVLGVSAGGKHRAYLISALSSPHRHVINDLLGDEPVTVTFCDRCQRAMVYQGRKGDGPLDLGVGGWYEGRMLLRAGNGFFFQDTGEPTTPGSGPKLPYARLPCEVTTWKFWKEAHPDSDVYTGDLPPGWPEAPGPGAS
ncbi:MAG TPA: DUF3179 domain-containing (seleno)protein [Gemmataceae bacterium]|nr:DUF3179 domain-containing (seleno)protein [Gemmataceae bacterium]